MLGKSVYEAPCSHSANLRDGNMMQTACRSCYNLSMGFKAIWYLNTCLQITHTNPKDGPVGEPLWLDSPLEFCPKAVYNLYEVWKDFVLSGQ